MNAPCVLCDKFVARVDEIVRIKCEGDKGCGRSHAWCKECWMSELTVFCPIEKKKEDGGGRSMYAVWEILYCW